MRDQDCKLCGASPADGFASINDDRYCHGDDPGSTCYERAVRGGSEADPFSRIVSAMPSAGERFTIEMSGEQFDRLKRQLATIEAESPGT